MAFVPSARPATSALVRATLAGCRLLDDVPPEVIDTVVRRAHLRGLARGEALFRTGEPGDAVFVVASGGVVARITTERGDVVDMAVARAGELIGHMDVLDHGPRSCDAVAVTPASVVVLPARTAEEILTASPATLRALAADTVRVVRSLLDATAHAFDPAPVRLATLLLDSAGEADRVDFDGPQELIARRLGVTRQTLNRALHTLAGNGLVTLLPGGRAVVLHRARLAAYLPGTAVRTGGAVAEVTARDRRAT